MAKKFDPHTLRNWMVIVSAVLMLALVIFQWLEIKEYNIQGQMWPRIKALFVSDAPPAAPAPAAAPADQEAGAPAPAAPAAPPAA